MCIRDSSEAQKLKQINEAEGKAREIELLASATAEGIRTIAGAINERGGMEAVNLRVAEQYVEQFGKLAKETNTLILPQEVGNIGGFVATVTSAMQAVSSGENKGPEVKVPVERSSHAPRTSGDALPAPDSALAVVHGAMLERFAMRRLCLNCARRFADHAPLLYIYSPTRLMG